MTFALRFGPIVEGGAIVKDGVIVNDLNIARLKLHVQMKIGVIRQGIKKIKRLDLYRGQPGDVCKPTRRFNVLPLINRRQESLVPGENRNLEVRLLSIHRFTAPVRLDRVKQNSQEIRPKPPHLVKDGYRTYKTGEPSRFGWPQA